MRIIVLGAAAGGGVPQWNCGCETCRAARHDQPALQATQTSVAFSADGANWFLINAAPDLRHQITATRELWPKSGALRHSPIAGVILTNGEVDAVAGLLTLREGSPFTLYAHPRVLAVLSSNSIFNVLADGTVRRQPIATDAPFEPKLPGGGPSGIKITPFAVPGKGAWYLEGNAHAETGDEDGDTLGLRVTEMASDKSFFFVAACAKVTPRLASRLAGADLVLFDGTVWRDDELIAAGLSSKTGQRMGHIAMSGSDGAIEAFKPLGVSRKLFLHVNNSNPALLPNTPERRLLEEAGWSIATDGMDITI